MIAGASPVIILSTSPQAWARSSGSETSLASSSALLTLGSSSCGQLLLFTGTIDAPLNGTSRMDCGSLKSFSHPVFGQTATAAFGTLQNFTYIVSEETWRKFTLNPSE